MDNEAQRRTWTSPCQFHDNYPWRRIRSHIILYLYVHTSAQKQPRIERRREEIKSDLLLHPHHHHHHHFVLRNDKSPPPCWFTILLFLYLFHETGREQNKWPLGFHLLSISPVLRQTRLCRRRRRRMLKWHALLPHSSISCRLLLLLLSSAFHICRAKQCYCHQERIRSTTALSTTEKKETS